MEKLYGFLLGATVLIGCFENNNPSSPANPQPSTVLDTTLDSVEITDSVAVAYSWTNYSCCYPYPCTPNCHKLSGTIENKSQQIIYPGIVILVKDSAFVVQRLYAYATENNTGNSYLKPGEVGSFSTDRFNGEPFDYMMRPIYQLSHKVYSYFLRIDTIQTN